jgi:hypothetical protein
VGGKYSGILVFSGVEASWMLDNTASANGDGFTTFDAFDGNVGCGTNTRKYDSFGTESVDCLP